VIGASTALGSEQLVVSTLHDGGAGEDGATESGLVTASLLGLATVPSEPGGIDVPSVTAGTAVDAADEPEIGAPEPSALFVQAASNAVTIATRKNFIVPVPIPS
jgi:hypothetical protein